MYHYIISVCHKGDFQAFLLKKNWNIFFFKNTFLHKTYHILYQRYDILEQQFTTSFFSFQSSLIFIAILHSLLLRNGAENIDISIVLPPHFYFPWLPLFLQCSMDHSQCWCPAGGRLTLWHGTVEHWCCEYQEALWVMAVMGLSTALINGNLSTMEGFSWKDHFILFWFLNGN